MVRPDPTTLALVEKFSALTKAAQTDYIKTLALEARRTRAPESEVPQSDLPDVRTTELTPLEAVLAKHLGACVTEFQQCWDSIGKRAGASAAEDRRDSVAVSRGMLLQALDEYLASHLPAPNLLPVTVSIFVPSRGHTFDGLVIQPGDLVQDLKTRLITKLCDSGLTVHGFTAESKFRLCNPGSDDSVPLEDESVLQLSVRVFPGARLILDGDIVLKDELRATCVRHTFDKASPTAQDYWTCRTCDVNWVCAGCRRECHKDHDLVIYLQQHTPTWGCCYCRKKGNCQLTEK